MALCGQSTTFDDLFNYVFVHIWIGSDVVNKFVLSQTLFYNYLALQIKAPVDLFNMYFHVRKLATIFLSVSYKRSCMTHYTGVYIIIY